MYQTYVAGLSGYGRPIGALLFLGPTGSGKTRTAEATAEALMGHGRAITKIDCGEFQHSHEIAKLIGSPPGYLGHRETSPLLSQENLDQYQTSVVPLNLVLFDEIEKASDALWNLLLGILDKATLTLGDNRRVDFSRSLIFMTGNLGAKETEALTEASIGFGPPPACASPDRAKQAALNASRRKFTPEFLNRLDRIIVFRALSDADLRGVLELELEQVQERISADCGIPFHLRVAEDARGRLLTQGTDARYGARHLRRTVERLVVEPVSNLIASAQVEPGDVVHVEADPAAPDLVFWKQTTPGCWSEKPGRGRSHCEGNPGRMAPGLKTKPARRGAPVGEISFGE